MCERVSARMTADAAALHVFPCVHTPVSTRQYVFMSVHQVSWDISYQRLGGQLMPYGCSTVL